jgi:ribosomal protein S18 acetylase RimI-like enzyme
VPVSPAELDHLAHPALAALLTAQGVDADRVEGEDALAICTTQKWLPIAGYWPAGSEAALGALRALLERHGVLVLLSYDEAEQAWLAERLGAAPMFPPLQQMVFEERPHDWPAYAPQELGPADYPEMQALVDLTQPGPFGPGSLRIGSFVGLREGGRLIAMGGLRLQSDRVAELTAICTHPEVQGRGLATEIVAALVDRVLGEGRTPFLHVAVENVRAIAVYRRLGFHTRRRGRVLRLESIASSR